MNFSIPSGNLACAVYKITGVEYSFPGRLGKAAGNHKALIHSNFAYSVQDRRRFLSHLPQDRIWKRAGPHLRQDRQPAFSGGKFKEQALGCLTIVLNFARFSGQLTTPRDDIPHNWALQCILFFISTAIYGYFSDLLRERAFNITSQFFQHLTITP
jgi:hypothetical protein